MDDDVASAASQLFGSGPRGLLVIDARELLTSTARVVGAQLGEVHFKVWMALITLHVVNGLPATGNGHSAIGELARLVWGAEKSRGGKETDQLVRALTDLEEARFAVPGYDMVQQRAAKTISSTRLLINLSIAEEILKAFENRHADTKAKLSEAELARYRRQVGVALGAKQRGTISWRLHPDYTQRLAESDLRRFDWSKAQQLRGVALALWMVFTSPRIPYRPMFGSSADLEMVEIPLTEDHCYALGVRASADAARRRTLNEAGQRVCAADKFFAAFEAHGGRGRDSFLRIVRTAPSASRREAPLLVPAEQLTLVA
jgi:hypothetical protein